jgi:hypothetical protein
MGDVYCECPAEKRRRAFAVRNGNGVCASCDREIARVPTLHGIENLRRARNLFDNCNGDFNDRWTIHELIQLYDAYERCGWDITPDRWSEEQVQAALQGTPPSFEE